jgi:predicted component of type VI protein secretion system
MNMRRMRGRGNRNGGGNFRSPQTGVPLNRNHVFDSNGPEQRSRGTAQQLYDKYLQLGRDASSSGDRVLAESYFQHAEHYFRIVGAMTQAQSQHSPQHSSQQSGHGAGRDASPRSEPASASQDETPEPQPEPEPQPQPQPQRRQANGQGRRRSAAPPASVEEAIEAELSGNPPGLGDQPSIEQRDVPIGVAPPEA